MELYRELQLYEGEESRYTYEERIRVMMEPLMNWYETNARVLPWRTNPEPYWVWVSEKRSNRILPGLWRLFPGFRIWRLQKMMC